MRYVLVLLVVAAVASVPGCGGDSQTYSVEETKAAFAGFGYVLVIPDVSQLRSVPQRVFVPKSGQSFVVVVGTDAEADEAWPDFERLQDADSFDARRANVAVLADDGPRAPDRQRVLSALSALPDRGSPVEVAGN